MDREWHMQASSDGRITKRPRRHPGHRWMDTLKSDLATISPGTELAGNENREKSREIVESAKVLNRL